MRAICKESGFGFYAGLEYDFYVRTGRYCAVGIFTSFDEESFDSRFEVPTHKKPPLGLTPVFVWKSERQSEILEAVSRYVDAKKDIPYQWIAEYWELGKAEFKK